LFGSRPRDKRTRKEAPTTFLDKRLAAIAEFTPTSGYNVVGVDDYELPGDELYLVAHVDTMAEAQTIVEQRHARNPEEILNIYAPNAPCPASTRR
jgi:hypothetical protein